MPSLAETAQQVGAALRPLRETLNADGYDLAVEAAGNGLLLRVHAQPEACEECLVPKTLFLSLIHQTLQDAGGPDNGAPIELVYPLDAEHAPS